jgi:hypothetical protein
MIILILIFPKLKLYNHCINSEYYKSLLKLSAQSNEK